MSKALGSDQTEVRGHPVLVQGSSAPLFRSEETCDSELRCPKCNGLLVAGYFPDCFIDIRIQCFQCKEIVRTPRLPEGEILPHPIITLGDAGQFLIGSTVNYRRSVALTTNSQIALYNSSCAPRLEADAAFEISRESFAERSRRYEELSGRDAAEGLARLNRYQAAGKSGSSALPFEWAIWRIAKCFDEGIIDIDDSEMNVALGRIYLFSRVLAIWGGHPRFKRIAGEFSNPGAFLHTIGQFLLAEFYYRSGLRVGFSVRDIHGEAKPDLYIRLGASERFFFEFKTPSTLQWDRHVEPTDAAIRTNVRSTVKNNVQINKSRPGAIVLMANHPAAAVCRKAEVEARSFLNSKGLDKRSLAGIVTIHCGGLTRETAPIERIGMNLEIRNLPNKSFRLAHNPLSEPSATVLR